MSSSTANTATTTETSAGMTIGVIISVIIILIAVVAIFLYMRRRNVSAPAAPTAANGLGVLNKGPNVVPRTNMNMNSGSRVQ